MIVGYDIDMNPAVVVVCVVNGVLWSCLIVIVSILPFGDCALVVSAAMACSRKFF